MRIHHLLAMFSLLAAIAVAQSSPDVGLTLGGGNVSAGQICGPVSCQPLPSVALARGITYSVQQNSRPTSPFVIGIGMPMNTCVPFPGIANGLLLGSPAAVLAVGVTGPPVPAPLCPRGVATVQFPVPATAPVAFAFHLQSVGVTWTNQLAFSPAIAAITQ